MIIDEKKMKNGDLKLDDVKLLFGSTKTSINECILDYFSQYTIEQKNDL